MESNHNEPGLCVAPKRGKLDVVNTKSIVTRDYARPSMEKAREIFILTGSIENTSDEIGFIAEDDYSVKRCLTSN